MPWGVTPNSKKKKKKKKKENKKESKGTNDVLQRVNNLMEFLFTVLKINQIITNSI